MKKTVLSLALICLGLAMTACGGKARAIELSFSFLYSSFD